MQIELDKKSVDQLNKLFRYMERETNPVLGTKLAKLIGEAAQEMATEAKHLSPFKTGRLRASIHAKLTPSENYQYDIDGVSYNGGLQEPVVAGKEAVIGTNVEYAIKQEIVKQYMYGAKKRIEPYLQKNLQKLAKEIIQGK